MSDMSLPICMDYLATTPVDRRVLDAMLPHFCESFGNASSATHSFGQKAAMAVALARRQVAALLDARERLESLRSRLFNRIASQLDGCVMKGCEQERLPRHLSLSFSGVSGTELISDLREVALSSEAACSSRIRLFPRTYCRPWDASLRGLKLIT